MKAYVFDGTPQEIAESLKVLGISNSAAIATAEIEEDEEEKEWRAMPTPVGRKMLSRIPLADKPKKAILAIYNAEDEGILGSELCKLLKYGPAQFRGMMGALGRRMANTKGFEDGMSFFKYDWDAEEGYRYMLPIESRAAVEAELLK